MSKTTERTGLVRTPEMGPLQSRLSVYDSGADAWLTPFYSRNVNTAMRRVVMVMQENPNHEWCLFPDQFTLFELGTFNPEDCSEVNFEARRSLGTMVEISRQFQKWEDPR